MAEIIKTDSNTYRIEDGFVRFFLLEGTKKAMLLDSGINCPDAKSIAGKLTDKPIILLNTHGDGDHTSGTAGFEEIHIHALDYTGCEVDKRYPDTKLSEINDGDEFDLGDRTVRIIHIPGHTRGSVAILDAEKRVLYAGDSVQKGHIYMFGNKREPDKFEDSLKKLISINNEYDKIYASHDEFELPGDYAKKVLDSWKRVRNGDVEGEDIELFGNKAKSYTTQFCGFYI